ncbi:MAG: SDR family oxidoreductase [candidate division Zixibacteria bacterium]|nr:SDR family oxidoreductase [candidate division Zixibacteria bacterium]
MISLKDKTVVVTGASMGIGAAIAQEFSSDGANVVLTARKESRLKVVAKSLGGKSLCVKADVSKRADIKRIISAARKKFGEIDFWINNAGVGVHKSILETSEKEYDVIMDTNVRAVFYSFQELLPLLKKQGHGHIISISSSVTRVGIPNVAVYSASKGALNLLSESVANEVRNDGIKISILSPASTETGLMRNFSKQSRLKELSPSRAAVKLTPKEVAEAVVFMAKQDSNAWTSMADIRPLAVRR